MVCDTKSSADGFCCESLYAAKLTYGVDAAQWQRALSNTVKLSTRRRALLENRRISKYQSQDDHGDGRDPGNNVVAQRVYVLAHQITPVHEQQNKDDHHWKPNAVAHLRENENLPKRRAGQQDYSGADNDQHGIEPIEDFRVPEFVIQPCFEAKALADYMGRR